MVSPFRISMTHSRRTVVITCMFGCICSISNGCIFVIWILSISPSQWIMSGYLFINLIASLWHNCGRSSFRFRILYLNMDITFALMRIFYIILIASTHNSIMRSIFYLWCLMYYGIIHILIYVIRGMHCTLKHCGISVSRL